MRVIVTTPAAPVIALSEALDHLKVDAGVADAQVSALVAAATGHAETFTGRSIGIQTLEARFTADEMTDRLILPRPPLIDLISIDWWTPSGTQVGDVAAFGHDDRAVYPLARAPWTQIADNQPDALRVAYRAGYEAIPEQIRHAILVMAKFLFDNGGSQNAEPPVAVEILLRPFQVYA